MGPYIVAPNSARQPRNFKLGVARVFCTFASDAVREPRAFASDAVREPRAFASYAVREPCALVSGCLRELCTFVSGAEPRTFAFDAVPPAFVCTLDVFCCTGRWSDAFKLARISSADLEWDCARSSRMV